MIDREGMKRAESMCRTLQAAINAQSEDIQNADVNKLVDISHLDEAQDGLENAADALRRFLDFTTECSVCDGMIGYAPKAEVVFKNQKDDKHHIIHQSCFRTADHEIA